MSVRAYVAWGIVGVLLAWAFHQTEHFECAVWMAGKAGVEAPVLSYWCFNAALAMRALADLGVRSIVLTSGTLAPLNSFAAELGLPFPITLENPHVVPSSQARPQAAGRVALGCCMLACKPVSACWRR